VPWGELPQLGATVERYEGEIEYWRVTGDVELEALQRYPQVQ
jgi:hypothetical protein